MTRFAFLLRRPFELIPVMFGISLITFILLQLTPGDPVRLLLGPKASVEAMALVRQKYGLDQPVFLQYFYYIRQIFLHLDFGESFPRHQPVFTAIKGGFGNTLTQNSRSCGIAPWPRPLRQASI